ncbi:DUF1642 domain-containing protein [Lactococcus lactis]|uniref:DUF1642 domain-containing protein n=1 Tax=Lactococcus lactis TaxID=1358 RepID=UPI00265A5F8B|nr:DUF1642 domain-containing protein [Lactococcus lactis]WKF73037.1 DUF1642 domain-containing protein [Lactococcus lactis]
MTSFTNRIKPDSTELERYFLSVYTGHLWDALEKIKDWHSPEHIEKEVQMKLLKIQQQALPVVPEEVAKLPGFDDMKEYLLEERLLTIRELLNKLDEKSNNDITEAEAWCMTHEHIVYRAILEGYTVKKQKLFYLKNKMTGLNLVLEQSFNATGKHVGERFREFDMQYIATDEQEARLYKNTFSKAEIKNMDAGNYEQIEVAE